MAIADQISATKLAILKGNKAQLVDWLQMVGVPGLGTVSIDGSGNVTIGGNALTNAQYIALGEIMGVTLS